MLYLREQDVDRLLPVSEAVEALEGAFQKLAAGEAAVRPRQRVRLPAGQLHVMPAGIAGGESLGLKVYSTFPGSGARFYVLLFDANGGALLAMMQADRLGQIRTGAASGLAARYMARKSSATLGVIGTGWQAQTQIEAVCSVRSIDTVRVYGRDEPRRRRFCETMSERVQCPVIPEVSARATVEGADIVVTITSSATPVIDGAWLRPGTHVNAAGVNQATKREIDDRTVLSAARIVTDLREQAQLECGDLIPLMGAGTLHWEDVLELADVVSGKVLGRKSDEEITLFESQGIALEDVAVAQVVYRKALEQGAGVELAL